MKNIHFIAGLPRSGSTLLAALLKQNPSVIAGTSSPLESIYSGAMVSMSKKNSFHTFITDKHRENILRAIIEAYYKDAPQDSVVFDTNKYWPTKLGGLVRMFPDMKMICCVRDIVSILNSFEHLVRKNPYEISRLFNFDPNSNVYARVDGLMHGTGAVGLAFHSLKEALSGEHKDRLILVEYDDLVANPKKVMTELYTKLNIPAFTHDLENVMYEEEAFDLQIGLPGMHSVRKKVEKVQRSMLIPKDLQHKYRGIEFW